MLIPRTDCERLVKETGADYRSKGLSSWSQFVGMLFCQLGRVHSLREIEGGRKSCEGKLAHLGITVPVRSSLSYANGHRPWQLFEKVFYGLFETVAAKAQGTHTFRFKNTLVSLDSTVIDLCLSMYDWANYRRTKGAVKLHLVLDHDGYLPCFGLVTDGKVADVKAWYDRKTRRVRALPCGDTRGYLAVEIRRVECTTCGKVKQETLDWLADNPFYTKRFAFFVGRRCRTMTSKDVAEETRLDWNTITARDTQDMQEQVRRAGTPAPKVVGIDEVSICKGHTSRIVVSDWARRRPIWVGGTDRSEASRDEFYQWLGVSKSKKIRLAVMDMRNAFRNSTRKPEHAPHAAILFDKFHVLRHLGEALDTVRKTEYARLTGKGRRVIKGQKYTRLSHRENLKPDGRRSLRVLLKANRRLNTAYLLKEEFGQL
jgi:transposase